MGLREWIKDAGEPSESDSDRDGFLSYSAEVHTAGVGLGVGWLAVATGNMQLLAVVLPAVTAGLRAKNKDFGKILTDLKQEPQYFLGAFVLGALLAYPIRFGVAF